MFVEVYPYKVYQTQDNEINMLEEDCYSVYINIEYIASIIELGFKDFRFFTKSEIKIDSKCFCRVNLTNSEHYIIAGEDVRKIIKED